MTDIPKIGCVNHDCGKCPRGTIEVMVKDQYGQQVYHPYNTDAKLLAQLAGTKTLTIAALKVAMQLGYAIEYIRPEVPAL